jgi:hypothetical protein
MNQVSDAISMHALLCPNFHGVNTYIETARFSGCVDHSEVSQQARNSLFILPPISVAIDSLTPNSKLPFSRTG